VGCNVLQRIKIPKVPLPSVCAVAVCCSECRSVLQWVAVCCNVLQRIKSFVVPLPSVCAVGLYCSECCSVLQ